MSFCNLKLFCARPAVFTIPKRSVYIKSHFWTDVNKTAAAFCFFLHFFVFAGSGIVVLLQATHNTLPARSTALHIGRRQPKALYACRFPPALRDQTRRWYRKRRSWTADAKCKWLFCFAQRN